jgi:hypothetical protein
MINGSDSHDERPLAVRRKRRASTGLREPNEAAASSSTSNQTQSVSTIPQTPTKAKKRVRFSDPGFIDAGDMPSTGITPFIKRTTLDPASYSNMPSSPRPMSRPPRRRQSLPSLRVVPSPVGLPSPPLSGEIQFAPLRQILDTRVRRRLRRNKLSEEMNDIEAEKRGKTPAEEELRNLKEELALAKQLGGEIVAQKDEERGYRERIEELEQEICRLKQEPQEMIAGAEVYPSPVVGTEEIGEMTFEDTFDKGRASNDFQIFDDSESVPKSEDNPSAETSTQTTLTAPELSLLQDHIRNQTEHLINARLELEYICPGETTLGLTTEQGNVKPVLDALVDRLRALKGQVHVSDSALRVLRMQESNLRNQFNTVLLQLDSARTKHKDTAMLLETVSSRSENKIKELRNDGDEKQRSIEKLQHALESYRSEVKGLEGLVISMELEHKEAMTKLRSDMDEAVADLECHVAAETRGRREAEEESEQRFFRIRELEAKERDLQAARNEKQRIIRSLEEELEKEKQERESEVGSLNVRIGELSSNLSEARADLVKMEAERARLVHRVEQEKLSAEKVVEKMREELKLSMDHLETIRDSYHQDTQSRGQEVLEHNGLLTPTSAVRFRGSESCEGHVVMTRGKSRKKRGIDSGIGILEEDQDEEMMM